MSTTYYPLDFDQAVNSLTSFYNTKYGVVIDDVNAAQISTELASNPELFNQATGGGIKPIYNKAGQVTGYGAYNVSQTTTTSAINSNVTTVTRGTVGTPTSTSVSQTGKLVTSKLQGLGSKAVTGLGKLLTGVACVSAAATLGKTVDEALYNANPDYWDSIGLSTLNPQTWSTIAGDNELGQDFINAIFGIDPNTGETQAYMDADALAYLAYCMAQAGIFNTGDISTKNTYTPQSSAWNLGHNVTVFNLPIPLYPPVFTFTRNYRGSNYTINASAAGNGTIYTVYVIDSALGTVDSAWRPWFISDEDFTISASGDNAASFISSKRSVVIDGHTYYYTYPSSVAIVSGTIPTCTYPPHLISLSIALSMTDIIKIVFGGGVSGGSMPDGISDQSGATIPDISGLSENEILPYLQNTYPDMFTNAINYPVVQPDGTVDNHTYVPITLPNDYPQTKTDPVTNGATQTNPEIDPTTATQPLIDLLTQLLTQPETEEIPEDTTPPENPTETGDGETPQIIAPSGSASALWAIYHPTQAQIDAFGAWLWSSDFIDQILKIFNNPMESIIGLHKVYATPIDAGTSTIGVGYLDSEVPSAYIEQQYVEVNCGTVNLFEQFGNVFDYAPFTTVKLYLPFIGIVNLDVSEVMRSSINVTYGVDVLTGACLARVKVYRDGYNNVMYQFAGNCAVQYPLSMGSYMGIVSSVIGVAGSIAATVATGGSIAPLAFGAASAAMGAHTSVQNSGNFSGNSGAMGGKIPYIIVQRPQTRLATNQQSFSGTPTNEYIALGDMSGFVRCRDMHLTNINATETELDEIRQYLGNGVIV